MYKVDTLTFQVLDLPRNPQNAVIKSRDYRLEPIKITSEILAKMGFPQDDSTMDLGKSLLWFERNGNWLFITDGEGNEIKKIDYVHQAQNIYLDFTGKELPLEL